MKVSDKDVLYVADLANLELTEEERQRMVKDLNSILDYIDMLGQLDTEGIEPMAQVVTAGPSTRVSRAGESPEPTSAKNAQMWGTEPSLVRGEGDRKGFEYAMRADEVRPGLPHEQAMMNAPETDKTYFKVPKVIGKSGEVAE